MENQSFWNHGFGKQLRSIFVLAIVWIPIYFAGEAFGGKGIIGCIIAEFVLLIAIFKLYNIYKKRKPTDD